MNFLSNKLHGLALCFAIAVPAAYLGKLFPIIGAPVFAIILGLLMAGIPRSDIFQGGITFTSKKILQYAIILLGFGMNLFEIFRVGSQSLLIIISTIGTALVVSYAVSRIMKINHDIATLVGVGSSICGGSAQLLQRHLLSKRQTKTLPSRFPLSSFLTLLPPSSSPPWALYSALTIWALACGPARQSTIPHL